MLSPCTVDLEHEKWVTEEGSDPAEPSFGDEVQLSDGGVHVVLGLQTGWKRCAQVLIATQAAA